MTCLGRTIAPSWTPGAVQPALDKTENSITVLGRKVQKNRRIGHAGGNPAGIRPGLHREYSAGPGTSSKFTSIPKTFKHPGFAFFASGKDWNSRSRTACAGGNHEIDRIGCHYHSGRQGG